MQVQTQKATSLDAKISQTSMLSPTKSKFQGIDATTAVDKSLRSTQAGTKESAKRASSVKSIKDYQSACEERKPGAPPDLPVDKLDLKLHATHMIAGNKNKKVKAFDFSGYSPRDDFLKDRPEPVESRFEAPANFCPKISTKHD